MTTEPDRTAAAAGQSAPPGPARRSPTEPMGGDPACWLDRVCAECGRFIDDPFAEVCPACGTPRG